MTLPRCDLPQTAVERPATVDQIINSEEEKVVTLEYWEDKQAGERQALCAWTIVLTVALAFQLSGLV
jgi:hypothetical protein